MRNEIGRENISQKDTEMGRTIVIRSNPPSTFPTRTMDEIIAIAKQHDMTVELESAEPKFTTVSPTCPSIPIYQHKTTQIKEILNKHGINTFYINLLCLNSSPTVIVGAHITTSIQNEIETVLKPTGLSVFFGGPIEDFEPTTEIRKKKSMPCIGSLHSHLQPGCSISLKANDPKSGTFGIVLTNGADDVGLTAGHVLWPQDISIKPGSHVSNTTSRDVIHPSVSDVFLQKLRITEDIRRAISEHRQNRLSYGEVEKLVMARKNMKSVDVGRTVATVIGYGNAPSDDDNNYLPCKLDYGIFSLRKNHKHNNLLGLDSTVHTGFTNPTGRVAEIRENMRVIKIGRETGITTGVVSYIKSPVCVDGRETSEWCVG
jgi:hypothetical protein